MGLRPQLEAHSDATEDLYCTLGEAKTGAKISISTMSDAIQHLKWTQKKDVGGKWKKWRRAERLEGKSKELYINKCRFIDEIGSNRALTRLYVRAPKGQRARGSIPCNRGKNVTLISDLSLAGLGELFLIDGTTNGDLFEAYIKSRFLC